MARTPPPPSSHLIARVFLAAREPERSHHSAPHRPQSLQCRAPRPSCRAHRRLQLRLPIALGPLQICKHVVCTLHVDHVLVISQRARLALGLAPIAPALIAITFLLLSLLLGLRAERGVRMLHACLTPQQDPLIHSSS